MSFRLVESVLKVLFPPRCAACREFVDVEGSLCEDCGRAWPQLSPPFCDVCVEPFASGPNHLCARCLEDEPAFDRLRATGLYEGLLLDLIVRLKYRGEERLASFLGDRMADILPLESPCFDLVLPVPLHITRLRGRGFNQALLLARRVGRRLGVAVDPFILCKIRPTSPQATLRLDERRKNLRGAFSLRGREVVRGKTVLLVDDVATTGTTLNEAGRVLKQAGVERVEAIVAARAV